MSAVVAVAALVLLAAPAAGIETATFGLDSASGERLEIPIRAGERTTARAVVWNKTDAPISLELRVAVASVDASGTASLGEGDVEVASWVSLQEREVDLGPQERQEVGLSVEPPSELSAETKTFALVAQAAAPQAGAPPAVLQRLALVGYLEPDPNALSVRSIPMWLVVVAAVVLLAVVAAAVRVRRRRPELAPSSAG